MGITGFSLSKITNVSSSLMTVLLALNLHSLAARFADRSSVSSAVPMEVQNSTDEKKHSSQGKFVEVARESRAEINKMLGWKSVNSPSGDTKMEEKEDESTGDPSLAGESSVQSDPRIQLAEKELRDSIATQKKSSDVAKETEERARQLEQERNNLDKKIQELSRSAEDLSAHKASKRKAAEMEMNRLAHVYEQMPPRDAAAVFNILDMRVMVPVAQRMIPRKVSAIMGGMIPDRANILSQYLAGMRKLTPDMIH